MFTPLMLGAATLAIANSSALGPEAAAKEWVALVDQQKWGDSWSASGALFQSKISKEGWASAVQAAREPLGTVSSRQLEKVTATKSLPGARDGDYGIVVFRTSFTQGRCP